MENELSNLYSQKNDEVILNEKSREVVRKKGEEACQRTQKYIKETVKKTKDEMER